MRKLIKQQGQTVISSVFRSTVPSVRSIHSSTLRRAEPYFVEESEEEFRNANSPWRHGFWIFPAICFGLSYWQWQRLQWKNDLIAFRESKLDLPPINLSNELLHAQSSKEISEYELRVVKVKGEFLHHQEFHLGTRTYKGQAGYHIITPFLVKDTNRVVLVNRGWVPYASKLPSTREEGQIKGEQTITGMIRFSSTPGTYTPDNDPVKNFWFWLDINNMSEHVANHPCVPAFILDLTEDNKILPGAPIPGQTNLKLPNQHLNYTLTWGVLGLCLSVLSFRISRKGLGRSSFVRVSHLHVPKQ